MKYVSLMILFISSMAFAEYMDLGEKVVFIQEKNFANAVIKNVCQNCRYQGSNMTNAKFESTVCRSCDFSNISGQGVQMKGMLADHSSFKYADLKNADLSAIRGYSSEFDSANLQNANLWGADLRDCSFKDADLRGANLLESLTSQTRFTGAVFNEKTKLPFTKEKALGLGMIWKP